MLCLASVSLVPHIEAPSVLTRKSRNQFLEFLIGPFLSGILGATIAGLFGLLLASMSPEANCSTSVLGGILCTSCVNMLALL